MRALLTGAFAYSDEQKKALRSLGIEISFIKDERALIEDDVSEYEIVVCNGLFLSNDIERFGALRFIQLTSVGTERVPLDYINKKSIILKNARNVYTEPIAETVILGVLALYRNMSLFLKNKENRLWEKSRTLLELGGKNVCIVGAGNIGTETARKFKAFGCSVTAVDVAKRDSDLFDEFYVVSEIADAISKSDIVVITLPINESTYHLFDEKLLSVLKKSAVIVNVSRGGIIDEDALCNSLHDGRIYGAVLDVFEKEPLPSESELWGFDNVILFPHNSFVSDRTSERMFETIYNNIKEFIK